MDIVISNTSERPIYEQISSQVKEAILSGDLAAGQQLPSIRALAGDLHVSVITTKRAYSDLESLGFIETVQGRGSFVARGNLELLREERLREVEGLLEQALADASAAGITVTDLHEMLDTLAEADM
ncbi:transcriptional regulator, GntR family [Olsenella uli DSM 7084]|uniref:Transcriptional regulator, GntR family n=1 Tax=Olsenella uli (strain ATCC 49627 / DSM 7084 / CCUG 31166 / CIP 109912 / JCM 12494 / LMG 11480 / NCIMB 702895 / VPI D76D-27C) TaxID=633147 RepID=E1QYE1_OLSUV|nr:GntR family transcriptional regulator [Olsenella uli]ADK67405.1 transcriptional regulator, GntR family [Olsenella uli DSM 7084]EUB31815.1 transcriptional regulator, GntR family [Olsenella uli MSTE5]KRO11947.1 GntR family transcriptional regulator [Olsenella uli DSM 7084]MBS6418641.1 GntR family transcriptional regulator [Olsenella uli]